MFKFKLETLFKVRKRNKEIIFKKWSAELGILQQLQNEKNNINKEHKKNKKLYMETLNKACNEEAQLLRIFIETFKFKFQDIDNRMEQQKLVIESLRKEMTAVSQDFEIISKLKEKKLNEFKESTRKKEEKYNDELSILKSKRGRKIGSI